MTYQNLGYWVAQANDLSGGAHPTGWTSGQRWSETAGEWHTMYDSSQAALATANSNYSTLQGQYNAQVAQYNALVAALNNPDGLTTTAISLTWVNDGTSSTATLTIPRNGHYLIAIDARLTASMSSGTNGYVQVNVAGIGAETYMINLTGSSGSNSPCYSRVVHGDYTAGQTISIYFNAWRNSGSASGGIYAHFVPNATYHN